jgi:hypothetical protein
MAFAQVGRATAVDQAKIRARLHLPQIPKPILIPWADAEEWSPGLAVYGSKTRLILDDFDLAGRDEPTSGFSGLCETFAPLVGNFCPGHFHRE